MNKMFIIGNLTRDPELRSTTNNINVCAFDVAVQRRFSGQGNERQTDYFRVNAWRGLADNCQKFLKKGSKVAVVGELQARTFEAKDGTTRISLDIHADEVEFLYTPRQEDKPNNDLPGFENMKDDELPFR